SVAKARVAIVDFSGAIVAQSSRPASGYAIELPSAEQTVKAFSPDPTFVQLNNGGAVVVPLSAPDLFMVMAWPDQQPLLHGTWGMAASLAAPLLIWMLAVAAGWFAIEVFVARPLSMLEGAARGYARGEDVPEAAELAGAPDEIRSLRRTLAAMAKTLRSRE